MTTPDDARLLTEAVGFARLPRDVVEVVGPDALAFLQGQLSQDLASVGPGESTWSLLLQPQGKLDAWLRASHLGDDRWILDTEAGWGEAVVTRLRRFLFRVDATITPLDWEFVAVRGPLAAEVEAVAEIIDDPAWPGVAGVDLLGDRVLDPPGVGAVDPAALEALRIAAGVRRLGVDADTDTIPAEAGLVDRMVSFTKGCYVGQELVARIDSRGGNVPRRLHRLWAETGEVPAAGTPVDQDGATIGTVTSAAVAPEGSGVVALAILKRAADASAPVTVLGAHYRAEPAGV